MNLNRQLLTTFVFVWQTEEHMLEANTESQSTLTKVYDLRERIERIKEKFLENEINVEQATRESNEAEEMAKQAQQVIIICFCNVLILLDKNFLTFCCLRS